jgi:hypothetical protein
MVGVNGKGRRAAAFAPYLLIAAAGFFAAYYQLFTQYAPQDDEGFVLLTLDQFLGGKDLYGSVYAQYGPFFYEFYAGIFGALRLAVDNDANRLIAATMWAGLPIGIGLLCARICRTHVVGAIAALIAFPLMGLVATTPGHPVGLSAVLTFAALAALLWNYNGEPRPQRTMICAGVALGLLAMTKINVGGLELAGLLAAALIALPTPAKAGSLLRIAGAAIALGTPIALMASNLDIQWVRSFLMLELTAIVALLLAAWGPALKAKPGAPSVWRVLLWTFGAAAAAAFVACAIVIVLGTSPNDLIHGVLLDPLDQPDVILKAPDLPFGTTYWVPLLLICGWIAARQLRPGERLSATTQGWLRLAAALALLVSATWFWWSAAPVLQGRLVVPLLLAWLAVAVPSQIEISAWQRFLRLAASLLVVLGLLQAYPVSGDHLSSGLTGFIVLAAFVVRDALALLQSAPHKAGSRPSWIVPAIAVAAVTAAFFAVAGLARPGYRAQQAYAERPALKIRGAERWHLKRENAKTLEALVADLDRLGCDPVISFPGLNSLYYWSGRHPPTAQNAGDWMFLLDNERQQQVVDAVRDKPNLCVVVNTDIADFWRFLSRNDKFPSGPMLTYLGSGFKEVDQVTNGRVFYTFKIWKRAEK